MNQGMFQGMNYTRVHTQIPGMSYPQVKYTFSCAPIKTKLVQWWDRHRINIPIQKVRIREERSDDVS